MAVTLSAEIAAAAARLVVEEGLDYGPAKRRALRDLGQGRAHDLPGNDEVEDEVRAYLELFHADSQPHELTLLRAIALRWMERMAAFRPHLTGAAWRGTATRLSTIHIDLYCDDSKAAELALLDARTDYEVSTAEGSRGAIDVLNVFERSADLGSLVRIAMAVRDYDDLRGALKRDGRGRSPRGDVGALRQLQAGA
ncbi:MAG: hypothetical protein ABI641_00290 [Caldimonas sp.]